MKFSGRAALRNLVVAVAYGGTGILAERLATPPEYATAVWPPAGLALAAAVVWGPAVLPGVWLGAVATNAWRSGDPGFAAVAALGAVLQAQFGRWVVARVAGPGNPLDGGRSIVRPLVVVALVSCVVGATWGVGTLLAAGRVDLADVPLGWVTWWMGDIIGVLVFFPPLLVWSAAPAALWRVRRWTVAGPLIVCFAAVLVVFAYVRRTDTEQRELHFQEREAPFAAAIERDLSRAADAVYAVGAFFGASEDVTRAEFSVFVRPSLERTPGLLALGWNPVINRVERAGLEARIRAEAVEGAEGAEGAEGVKEYTVSERGPDGELRPAAERDRYAPVVYTEPLGGNEAALGFDVWSEPSRRAAAEASIDRAEVVATAALRLVQIPETSFGALLFLPVYATAEPPSSIEERRAQVRGFAVAVVSFPRLVEQAISGLDPSGLDIRIRDLDAPGAGNLLYGEPDGPTPQFSAPHELTLAGRRWQIEIGDIVPRERSWSEWAVLAGGLLFTGLVGAFLLELVSRRVQVESLVATRTRELDRANQALAESNLELQRFAYVASHDLREPLRIVASYGQLLDESAAELQPTNRKYLRRIVDAARRMQALVDDLLALSRLEGEAPRRLDVALADLLERALGDLQHAVAESGAEVTAGVLPVVWCEPSEITQLFQNLVSNAIKFRKPDQPPRVRVEGRTIEGGWEITVADEGIGVPAEARERIFEMFERLHNRGTYAGTGIGLAICRRVVERHGGRMWVDSPDGAGSCFHFTLRSERSDG